MEATTTNRLNSNPPLPPHFILKLIFIPPCLGPPPCLSKTSFWVNGTSSSLLWYWGRSADGMLSITTAKSNAPWSHPSVFFPGDRCFPNLIVHHSFCRSLKHNFSLPSLLLLSQHITIIINRKISNVRFCFFSLLLKWRMYECCVH